MSRRRPIRFLPPDTQPGNVLPLISGQARIIQHLQGLPCCFTSAGRRHLALPPSRREVSSYRLQVGLHQRCQVAENWQSPMRETGI